MVKRRDSKTFGSKSDPTPTSSATTTPSGASTPVSNTNIVSCSTLDWNKIDVPFKRSDFKVINAFFLIATKSFYNCYSDSFQRSYRLSSIASGKKRQWKALKQIIAQEMSETTSLNTEEQNQNVNYASIEAPPSFKPFKKYSDLSGLEANYTDPHTKLNFSNIAEFKLIKKLPSDLIAGYLTLRKANVQLQ